MRICFLLAALFCFTFPAESRGVTQADVQPIWDELSARWSANDMAGARTAADRLVEALEPVATDFSMGIQMNSALHNRASLRYNTGDYKGAEEDLVASVAQARSIQPPAGMPEQALPQMMAMVEDRVRLSLRGLTNFYLAAGDLERATKSFEEAIAIVPLWKKQAGDNPAIGYQVLAAEISSMEGTFYRATGDYVKATEAFVTRLEEIDGAWASVLKLQGGTENDFSDQLKMNYLRGRANVLMELAEIAVLREMPVEGVGFCKQARESAQEMFPLYRKWAETTLKTNPAIPKETIQKTLEGVETNMNYLFYERSALIFRAVGEERAALDLMLEGLKRRGDDFEQQRMLTLEYNVIRPEESLKMIGDLKAILEDHVGAGETYDQAISLTLAQYPGEHPVTLDIQESRALLAHLSGDQEKAAQIAGAVLDARMKNLSDVLSFADEPQRLAYRSSIDSWSLFASLGMEKELATAILRTKGIVLESLLEERGLATKSDDPKLAAAYESLLGSRRRLMELLLSGADSGKGEIPDLKKEISDLENQLKSGSETFGAVRETLTVTEGDVSNAIPAGGALIEFIRYRDYTAPGRFTSRYGGLVLKQGESPVFVPLDTAEKIEGGMEVYAKAVRTEVPDEEMAKFLTALGASVWDPLLPHLPAPGASLILSPDGALNFLSFATLLGKDSRFVGETWSLSYVSSGRDLLSQSKNSGEKTIEIIANPDFQTPATDRLAAERSVERSAAVSMRGVLGRIGLSPLPGTKAEEEALRELITTKWKWTVHSHLEQEATEASVNAVKSPAILHLATHGFFLPRTGKSDALQRARGYWESGSGSGSPGLESFSDVVLDNPMHRSGVALAGAEATLKEWGGGRILDTANDGILTAGEMSLLDLEGTWLVVLSACETGLGESRSGEGVLGMRRGLIEAGAQHLLITLWPVADRETALFMRDLYANLNGGEHSPVEISPKVQAAYLKQFREDQGISAAVRLAGPFILSYRN
jgi:tetratricopeptide (TPR) repeat protein